ncbi:MAG: carboxypeptidase regulatory-like domain-containing protein [Planctomycetota bacterium]|nr:MAG: carboxypeptidase regulatory-like domain-containing protein [Planctomycetota bacterium]
MLRSISIGAVLLLVIGCNRGPNVGLVEGVVTLDGQPVPNAMVTFSPIDGGMSSTGTTDENGHYTLVFPGGKGAVVGRHKVSVRSMPKSEGGGAAVSSDDPSYYDAQQSPNTTKTVEPIPAKYNTNTTLEYEVKKGTNVINLELTSN